MEMTLILFLTFLGVGLGAGFVAGFVGVGGGIIMVPVLLEIFRNAGTPEEAVVQAAMATSLSVAVFSVGSSIFRHRRQGRIRWNLVRWLAPGSLLGGWLAAHLATRLPGHWLQWVLSVLMIFAAVRMLRNREMPDVPHKRASRWKMGLTGLGVGLVAGMSGLAGGIVLVPALSLILGVPGGWLAGTSSGTIIFSALAAALGYLSTSPAIDLGSGFFGYVCLPLVLPLALGTIPAAQLGAMVNRRIQGNIFQRIFGGLLLVVALRLLLNA